MDDVISRQAAIDTIEKHLNGVFDGTHYDEGIAYGYEAAHRHIQDLINALQPAQQWIPVSERLPEKNGRYLVTRGSSACGDMWNRVYIINYSDLMGIKSKRIWWYGNVGKLDFVRVEDVIAWTPLLEPYREEIKNGKSK